MKKKKYIPQQEDELNEDDNSKFQKNEIDELNEDFDLDDYDLDDYGDEEDQFLEYD